MSNDQRPHLLILPEDAALADIANGFLIEVDTTNQARVERFGGGKTGLRERAKTILSSLHKYPTRYVAILFDGDRSTEPLNFWAGLRKDCPAGRVFFFWTQDEAEDLRREMRLSGALAEGNSLERIGRLLADECRTGHMSHWKGSQLQVCSEQLSAAQVVLRPLLYRA